MPTETKSALTRLLLEFSDQAGLNVTQAMLEAAQKGLTVGANECVETVGKGSQPAERKQFIQCYPLAHALLGLATFIELNKDTDVARHLTNAFIDALEHQKDSPTVH